RFSRDWSSDVCSSDLDGTTEEIDDNKLYRVVAGLYSGQMLPVVSEKSFGLLKLEPKKKDGTPITDFEEHIIYMNDGTNREIKERSEERRVGKECRARG